MCLIVFVNALMQQKYILITGGVSDSNPIHFQSDSVNILLMVQWLFCVYMLGKKNSDIPSQPSLCKQKINKAARTEFHNTIAASQQQGAFMLVHRTREEKKSKDDGRNLAVGGRGGKSSTW